MKDIRSITYLENAKAIKRVIFAGICVFTFIVPSFASALTIGFESEIHTKNGSFSIHNISDPGYYIYQVDLVLGQNMQFDTVRDVIGSPDTPGFGYVNNFV